MSCARRGRPSTSTATCVCSRPSTAWSRLSEDTRFFSPLTCSSPSQTMVASLVTARSCSPDRSTSASPLRERHRDLEALFEWWTERLRTGSRLDPTRGIVYDQRWADLMPGTVRERRRSGETRASTPGTGARATSRCRATGRQHPDRRAPLRSFHFTGFDPGRPERLSRLRQPHLAGRGAGAAAMCADFVGRLAAAVTPRLAIGPTASARPPAGAR